MPVAVVVGIALHSLLNGKLLYSARRDRGLMFGLLFSGSWDQPFKP
jgi:hypothetical protein